MEGASINSLTFVESQGFLIIDQFVAFLHQRLNRSTIAEYRTWATLAHKWILKNFFHTHKGIQSLISFEMLRIDVRFLQNNWWNFAVFHFIIQRYSQFTFCNNFIITCSKFPILSLISRTLQSKRLNESATYFVCGERCAQVLIEHAIYCKCGITYGSEKPVRTTSLLSDGSWLPTNRLCWWIWKESFKSFAC